MKRIFARVARTAFYVFAGLFALATGIIALGPTPIEIPFRLVFGWARAVPRLLHNPFLTLSSSLVIASACLFLVAGTHNFLDWLYSEGRRENRPSKNPAEWPLKWTLCGFGILFCSMLAIGGVILTVHQVFWLSRKSAPLFHNPMRDKIWMNLTVHQLKSTCEKESQTEAVQRAFYEFAGRERPEVIETIQPIWIENSDHTLHSVVLVPRRALSKTAAKIRLFKPGSDVTTLDLEELPNLLARLAIAAKPAGSP